MRLPQITYPLKVDTIGKLIVLGYEVTGYCHNEGCRHSRRVNLVALARRRGVDLPPRMVRSALYCRPCREAGQPDRNVSLTVLPCVHPHSTWPREAGPIPG